MEKNKFNLFKQTTVNVFDFSFKVPSEYSKELYIWLKKHTPSFNYSAV